MSNTAEESKSYSIQEASRISGLAESTLRYYESIGILPAIGRDPSSRHRRYTERDVDAAISVACLSATGMSIDDMRAYLTNRAGGVTFADDQIALLERQQVRLTREQADLRLRRQYLAVKVAYWRALAAGDEVEMARLKRSADALAERVRAPHVDGRKEAAA